MTNLARLVLCLTALFATVQCAWASSAWHKKFYTKATVFEDAIRKAGDCKPTSNTVTGVTVPHHLIVAPLIPMALRLASDPKIKRILLLFPDHFRAFKTPFATTHGNYETVLGPVSVDDGRIAELINHPEIFTQTDKITSDHGMRAVLPFITHYFPKAEVIPIAISSQSRVSDWKKAYPFLKAIVDDKTLIIQSTDFSHYLPHNLAIRRDQEALNLLATRSDQQALFLRQPFHVDSTGAQYLQNRLQNEIFNSALHVLENLNSQIYSSVVVKSTTSYVVQIYTPNDRAGYFCSNEQVFYFGGDVFTGRYLHDLLVDKARFDVSVDVVRALTRGRPLIVNLEGVLLEDVPSQFSENKLAMNAELAIEWLKAVNTVGVIVANNHAMDFGKLAYQEMTRMLKDAGFAVVENQSIVDFGPFRLVAMTDLSNAPSPKGQLLDREALRSVGTHAANPPLIAFLHWGEEYLAGPTARQRQLADQLRLEGVSAIFGAHSHRSSGSIDVLAGGETQVMYSLGNLLFDQNSSTSTGSLLEIRFFAQGTFFSRPIKLPNLYERLQKRKP